MQIVGFPTGWLNSFEPTFIKALALVKSPKVVCLEDSGPTGTMSFNFSKQCLKLALLKRTNHSVNVSYSLNTSPRKPCVYLRLNECSPNRSLIYPFKLVAAFFGYNYKPIGVRPAKNTKHCAMR